MTLSSPAFADGAEIPAKYTRAEPAGSSERKRAEQPTPAEAMSPPLTWTNVPPGTQSLLLHVQDVDTPQQRYPILGPTRLHWLVWNIPAATTSLPEGVPSGETLPDGSSQLSARSFGYLGPGADQVLLPNGQQPGINPGRSRPDVHRYRFELWALDTKLEIKPDKDAEKTRAQIILAMEGHVLAQAYYFGRFTTPGAEP